MRLARIASAAVALAAILIGASAHAVTAKRFVTTIGVARPWTPSFLPELVSAWSSRFASPAGGPVTTMRAYGPLAAFNQEGGALLPTVASGRVTFSTANGAYLSAGRLKSLSATTLPDGGTGSTSGKGFTNTGLAKDLTDGTWWVGNYGKPSEATQGSTTFAASVVHMSADFSAILGQITFASLGITQNTTLAGPQGIAFDSTDNTLWVASPETNSVYHVSRAGSLLGTLTGITGANGLTYDPFNDQLVFCIGADNPTLTWINKSTGATVRTLAVTMVFADHLFIDPAVSGRIWATGANNGDPGVLAQYDSATGAITKSYTLINVNAVEGVYISGNSAWLNADGFYHQAGSLLNQVFSETLTQQDSYPAIASRYQLFGTAHIPSAPGATSALIALGSPTTALVGGASPAQPGAGIYFPSGSSTTLNFVINKVGFTFSVATTTAFLFVLDVDTAAKTASLYVNGTFVSTADITTATPPVLGAKNITLGNGDFNGAPQRPSSADIGNLGVANNSQAARQTIEGWAAWDAGQQSLLAAGHPFKSRRPMH